MLYTDYVKLLWFIKPNLVFVYPFWMFLIENLTDNNNMFFVGMGQKYLFLNAKRWYFKTLKKSLKIIDIFF